MDASSQIQQRTGLGDPRGTEILEYNQIYDEISASGCFQTTLHRWDVQNRKRSEIPALDFISPTVFARDQSDSTNDSELCSDEVGGVHDQNHTGKHYMWYQLLRLHSVSNAVELTQSKEYLACTIISAYVRQQE